jgi:hypothetical protein
MKTMTHVVARSAASFLFSSLALFAACKGASKTEAAAKPVDGTAATAAVAAPAAATASHARPDAAALAGLDLVITAPAGPMTVGSLWIESADAHESLDAFKASLDDPADAKALPDGFEASTKVGDDPARVVERTVAGKVWRCTASAPSATDLAAAEHACLAIWSADGGTTLSVPFKLSGASDFTVGDLKFSVEPAAADAPATPEAALAHLDRPKTGKILSQEKLADGFGVTLQSSMNDAAANGAEIDVLVRRTLGKHELTCTGGAGTADDAKHVIDLCKSIQAL